MKLKLQKLKKKLSSLGSRVKAVATSLLKRALRYLTALAIIGLSIYVSLRAPEMHNHYMRHAVGQKVYMIRDSLRSGGGTGFAVQAPSGENYIITNDHVCEVSKDGLTVLVTDQDGSSIRRRIIAHDENSDLCLIEGVPGVTGLELANSTPEAGETLTVVGHPALLPLTLAKGEMISRDDVYIMLGAISYINPRTGQIIQVSPEDGGILPSQCEMRKHLQEDIEVDYIFFKIKIKVCVLVVEDAYVTNMQIRPGNSGSPVVDFWGNVTGVVFAGDSMNWGRMVSLHDLSKFLENY